MNKIFTIAMVALMLVFTLGVTLAIPNGANEVSYKNSTRLAADSPKNYTAIAGNVTELDITGRTITQSWQGYYGNVSGSITLSDSAGNPMYNWSLASPQGEVFASTNGLNLDWTGVKCFNWTENGTDLESTMNIDDAADGINETFETYILNAHADFIVGSTEFNETTACMSTEVFDSSGDKNPGVFEEVLLSDASGNPIFAALLEQDVDGFNSITHDFQMLVLEDGHGNTETTDYFFYVELE
ncbi:hypothetical protein KAS08_04250 [Candidatus Pacearchaeota archaeon]|nr:hypothetical protein [Candidatus Pacearchaeota archaeon]